MGQTNSSRRRFLKTAGLSAAMVSQGQWFAGCASAADSAAAGKSMGNCVATGHAAGLAAALAAGEDRPPREVDVKKLQAALRADGVDLTRGGQNQPKLWGKA